MPLRMWTYDIAREQCPDLDILRRLCEVSLASGYNALGLYFEHRFAFPSAPWAHGKGCLMPEMVRTLQDEFPSLKIIPFLNLLGHFEGFLYTEPGAQFAAERFKGMQADPTNPAFLEFAGKLLDDVLSIFSSDIIHIGGDETEQLGMHGERASSVYGGHFGPLAQRVIDAGRTPAVWGDMFKEHPEALDSLPQETVIFDWVYFEGPEHSSRMFLDRGFKVVTCPTIFTYNAVWTHLAESEANIRAHVTSGLDTDGICVTTWECGLFGNYEVLLPAIRGAAHLLNGKDAPDRLLTAYVGESELHEDWARLMGVELPKCGGPFAYSGIRSGLKCRFLLYANPFLLWLRHRDELCGEPGDLALAVLEKAISIAPNSAYRGISEFARMAIEFCRHTEAAHQAYARHEVGGAISHLTVLRQIFDNLSLIAKAKHLRFGGSLADIERCRVAKEHVEKVILRVKHYGDGVLGYLPSFESITHPMFVPHDQANWWLINTWAKE